MFSVPCHGVNAESQRHGFTEESLCSSFLSSFKLLTGNNQRQTKKESPEYEFVSECNYSN